MRKAAFIFFLLLVSLPAMAKPAESISPFIKAQRQAFVDSYGQRQDKNLLKEFGYGTGVYVNVDKEVTTKTPFEWYAYCGPDGFVFFQFNILVSDQDRYKIMIETDQSSDRAWDVTDEGNETRFAVDSKWIGCAAKQNCNYRKILDDYLAKFMKFSFFAEMKTTAYP